MQQKELGATGSFLPELGIGTSHYTGGPELLRQAAELGAFFFDTAESYGTEPVLGQALRGIRERAFVSTKVSPENLRPEELRKAADQSLLRLGIGQIDLYQIHRPNPAIPIGETLNAMEELVTAGKVRYIGVSNFTLGELEKARAAMRRYPIVSNQVLYNLIDRTIERGLLDYCQKHQITVLAFSPMARGIDRILEKDRAGVLSRIAGETGKSPAQIALNWCHSKPGVIAITKSNSPERIVEACGSSGWRLSPEQLSRLDRGVRFRRRRETELALRRTVRSYLDWMKRRLPAR